MKNKTYFLLLACIFTAFFAHFIGPYISTWMASDAPHPGQQQRLHSLYQTIIFRPLSRPSQPIPLLLMGYVPSIIFQVLFWSQLTLLIRRICFCIKAKEIIAAPHINNKWNIILFIGLFSWVISVIIILVPRIIGSSLGSDFFFGAGVVTAFILPIIIIPFTNLLGAAFFILELASIKKEGVINRPNKKLQSTAESGD